LILLGSSPPPVGRAWGRGCTKNLFRDFEGARGAGDAWSSFRRRLDEEAGVGVPENLSDVGSTRREERANVMLVYFFKVKEY
jgi:hypothetical protein